MVGKRVGGKRRESSFEFQRIVAVESQHGRAKFGEILENRVEARVGRQCLIDLDRRLRIASRALVRRAQTREDRITFWPGSAQGIESGRGFGGLAVARQLRSGFVFRAGCLCRRVTVMAIEAPSPRPGHDENSQGNYQIPVFGP
jgi:hypothetical protein